MYQLTLRVERDSIFSRGDLKLLRDTLQHALRTSFSDQEQHIKRHLPDLRMDQELRGVTNEGTHLLITLVPGSREARGLLELMTTCLEGEFLSGNDRMRFIGR